VVLLFYDGALKDKVFDIKRFQDCSETPWCAAIHRQLRPATVMATDANRDIALLQVSGAPAGLPAAAPADERTLPEPGELVSVISHPKDLLWAYTVATVSGVRREFPLGSGYGTVIQTQTPINSGNAGGAMFGSDGKLVGVVVSQAVADVIETTGNSLRPVAGQGPNFAIWVKEVLAFTRAQLKAQ
jgi:S1-C subfamily serine protease